MLLSKDFSRISLLLLSLISVLLLIMIKGETKHIENIYDRMVVAESRASEADSLESLVSDIDKMAEIVANNQELMDAVLSERFGHITKVTATVYNATVAQCDATPDLTASNTRFEPHRAEEYKFIAVSRNLHERWGGKYRFGDIVLVSGTCFDGEYIVADTMNERFIDRIDLLVDKKTKKGKWSNVTIKKIGSLPNIS